MKLRGGKARDARRLRAYRRLVKQLATGKKGDKPLTDKDIARIERDMAILHERLNGNV